MSEGPPYPPHPDERPSPSATRDDRDSVDDIEDLLVQKGQRMAELLRQKEEVIGHLDNERKGLKEQLANVTDALREARLSQSSVTSERSEVASDRRPVSRTPADGPALARQMSRQGEVEVTPKKLFSAEKKRKNSPFRAAKRFFAI